MKILWVAGARPNFMKIAPIWRAISSFNDHRRPDETRFEPLLVHTGQHYDANMSSVFFRDLSLPDPHYFLGVGGGSHAEQTSRVMVEFERLLQKEQPAMVGVVGDVNSTCACALTTAKSYVLPGGKTPVLIHVEAGLRSGDRLMPEEVNRLVTDVLADLLFTSEESGTFNLIREGVPNDRIFFVGNVMVDSLFNSCARPGGEVLMQSLGIPVSGPIAHPFGLVTLHRPSNVDDAPMLRQIMQSLEVVGKDLLIIFPVHPRTRANLAKLGFDAEKTVRSLSDEPKGLHLLPPLGYADFLTLLSKAAFVITDSGGIQEETTALGIPCMTLRENTERPVTVTLGTNLLLGRQPNRIIAEVEKILSGKWKAGSRPPLWDGHAAERIVSILATFLERSE